MHRSLSTLVSRGYMANSNYVYNKTLPQVFMDLKVDQQPSQRVVIELFEHVVPRTTENFLSLMKGTSINSTPRSYKNTQVSRVIPGLGIQMGEISGDRDVSIYGGLFEDESYAIPHDEAGIVTMLNQGQDSNASQFFITLNPLPHMDYNNVAFGKVVQGREFLFSLDRFGDAEGNVAASIVVEDCGQVQQ